jgi:hypothetical protein
LEHRASNPVSVKKFNRYRNLNNCKVVEALCSSGNEEDYKKKEEEEVHTRVIYILKEKNFISAFVSLPQFYAQKKRKTTVTVAVTGFMCISPFACHCVIRSQRKRNYSSPFKRV